MAIIVNLLLILLGLLYLTKCAQISQTNLQLFFNSTYDTNHDGYCTIEQFTHYFRIMQPQADIKQEDVRDTFEAFDSNSDTKLTMRQLVGTAGIKIRPGYRAGHKQIHISFSSVYNEMQIMWISNPESYNKPIIKYGTQPWRLNCTSYAITKTYNVGHYGFHGKIYKSILTNLMANTRYYYKVGDQQTGTFSDIKYFKSRPQFNAKLQEINVAVFGDMGTFAPCGHLVINQIARDNFVKAYDFVFLTGDIAYAGISSEQKGQIEPIWDLFGQLTQSFSAYSPFMLGVGNHEKYYNYSAYTARYELPRQHPFQTNFYFSLDYGQLHIAYFSSEHDHKPGSEQYLFLQSDLRSARNNPNTKWIIVGTHRPFYSFNHREYTNLTDLAKNLEQLVNRYKVDIVQTGHIHSYQRTWPMYKSAAQKQGHTEHTFKNPKHPIYVVQATAGALQYEKWLNPVPEYAIKKFNKYGYGRINIKGNVLRYQFIHAPTSKILDQWTITKDN